MEYEAQNVGEVDGLGTIYRVDAPLDEQLRAFARKGIRTLATPEELAQIRLAGIRRSWSRTSVAPIAIKGGKTVLIKNSPLMNILMAASAVTANRLGGYLTLSKNVYGTALAIAQAETCVDPEYRNALTVSKNGYFDLKVDMDETRFLLGKHTSRYFENFVKGGKNGQIPFFGLEGAFKDRAIINYQWFDDPQNVSSLDCRNRGLCDGGRAFGVLSPAKGRVQNKNFRKK